MRNGTSLAPLRLGVDGRELTARARTGIRRYVVEVLRAAVEAGWTVTVYGDDRTTLDGAPPGPTLRVLPAACTAFWDQVALPRALRRDRIRVFLSPYYKGPLFAPCPVVLTIHDLFFIGYPGRPRPVRDAAIAGAARLYARAARFIVADSEHSRRAVVSRLGVAPDKVHVVPVALGPEFTPTALPGGVRARYGLATPYVLYVGNFKPHKNVPALLRAWAALPSPVRTAHRLVLAGGDDTTALRSLATSLAIEDGVVFSGPVDDADLPAVYSGAAALVLPSFDEGFGLPALEAMACGTPVVASDRGAVPEVVGDAGVLVDPDAHEAITTALASVLDGPAQREELRRRGLARAAAFSRGRTAGRVLDVLAEAAGGRD